MAYWSVSKTGKGSTSILCFEGNGPYYNRLINDMGKDVKPEKREYCVDRSIDFLKNAATENKPVFYFIVPNCRTWTANKMGCKKKKQPNIMPDMPIAKQVKMKLIG